MSNTVRWPVPTAAGAQVARPQTIVVPFAASAPTNTSAPVASGAAAVGSTVSTTDGLWSSADSFTYQWQRDVAGNSVFSNIGSATSSSYLLAGADLTCQVRCVVTATSSGGGTSANSNVLGPVGAALAAVADQSSTCIPYYYS